MSKAILIFDYMPRVCSECDLFKNYYDDEHENWYYACALTEKIIDSDISQEERRCDCPLIKIPSPDDENWNADFIKYLSELTEEEI